MQDVFTAYTRRYIENKKSINFPQSNEIKDIFCFLSTHDKLIHQNVKQSINLVSCSIK